MTYLAFLLWFVIGPALVLGLALHWTGRGDQKVKIRLRRHWLGTSILALIALLWTTPWDNAIIAKGVWSYGSDRVLATVGLVPVEEYAFMILMPFFNAGVMGWFLAKEGPIPSNWRSPQPKARWRMLFFYGALWSAALAMLIAFEAAFYLSSILVWFIPPLLIQSLFDPACLLRHRRLVVAGTFLPTLYFSIVDALAIDRGIWTIHEATRSGLEIGNLPVEEAFFFFTTSLLLAQGLVLWHGLFHPSGK